MTCSKPVLLYFDFAFWKAEVPRLCFQISGKEFEDRRVTREQQADMKAKGELPFGQLPVLYVGDKWLTQGTAIIRYVAKQTGFYPKDDFEAAKVDEVLNLIEDCQVLFAPSFREKDPAKKKQMQEEFAQNGLPNFLGQLEKLLQVKSSRFVVGKSMTCADLAIWKIVEWFLSGRIDNLDATTEFHSGKYPKLFELYAVIDKHEKVATLKEKYGLNDL